MTIDLRLYWRILTAYQSKSLLDNKKRFDIKSFLKISAKIAETLGSIHVKGVIHRDIKPHNILINPITERCEDN